MSQFERITNGNAALGVDTGNTQALIVMAERIVAQAKVLAPVDLGQLRNAIMYSLKDSESGFNDGSGESASFKIRRPAKDDEAFVGFNLLYGIYQEFGARYIAPQPFLRVALDIVVNGTDALTAIAKAQVETMQDALRRGQRGETFNV